MKHTYSCSICDYSKTEPHNFEYTDYHIRICSDCGESSLAPHIYDSWVFINETVHISECGCGNRGLTTQHHAFRLQGKFLVCIGCGYTKLPGSDYGNIIMSTSRVSLNGSYITADGTIILVDEDIEAYLNGTLVFYDKNNLPVTQ